MKRLVRILAIAAVVAGVVGAVRSLRSRQDPLPSPSSPSGQPWPPLQPEPASGPATRAATRQETTASSQGSATIVAPEPDGVPVHDSSTPWTEPTSDGECPDGFPIKAKLSSKIFHAPGQLNYERTTPDRCYSSAEAAEADGLRAAKR